MSVREQRDVPLQRYTLLFWLTVSLLGGVTATYWGVQVVAGGRYRQLAEHNRLRRSPIRPQRGRILDRNGHILVENVPSYSLVLHPRLAADVVASEAFAAEVLGRPLLDAGRAESEPRVVGEELTLAQVAEIELSSLEHPELEVRVEHLRLYRQGAQTAHLVGYLGEVSEAELASSEQQLQRGDSVGRRGLERRYDEWLRGRRGEQVVIVDSRGRTVEEYHRDPATPGRDLALTLDIGLQQEAEQQLAGKVGAVVALDPRNGELLAMVSTPAYDPNLFTRRMDHQAWQSLLAAPHHPLQNRVLQSAYPPGSPFKIVMAVAGLEEGVIRPTDRQFCAGSIELHGARRRCWTARGHGWVNLHEAIKQSCDVYFYVLGESLGIERIAKWARRFGLGQPTGFDLAGEKAGLVPDAAWKIRARGAPWQPGETVSVAIGQGPILLTPLQMAEVVAVVANGGRRVIPHVRLAATAGAEERLGASLETLDRVRRALSAVVNEQGTGRLARVDGLEVAGKTGTVQVVSQETWTDNKELPWEQRDHAWFVSFAPAQEAELVVVVFVEHGGKGSQVAAPIAKRMYERYFRERIRAQRQLSPQRVVSTPRTPA